MCVSLYLVSWELYIATPHKKNPQSVNTFLSDLVAMGKSLGVQTDLSLFNSNHLSLPRDLSSSIKATVRRSLAKSRPCTFQPKHCRGQMTSTTCSTDLHRFFWFVQLPWFSMLPLVHPRQVYPSTRSIFPMFNDWAHLYPTVSWCPGWIHEFDVGVCCIQHIWYQLAIHLNTTLSTQALIYIDSSFLWAIYLGTSCAFIVNKTTPLHQGFESSVMSNYEKFMKLHGSGILGYVPSSTMGMSIPNSRSIYVQISQTFREHRWVSLDCLAVNRTKRYQKIQNHQEKAWPLTRHTQKVSTTTTLKEFEIDPSPKRGGTHQTHRFTVFLERLPNLGF